MKTIKILILSIILLLITACGSKTVFKTQDPLENAALVYIYTLSQVTADDDTRDPEYSIRINNKPYMQRVKEGEYVVLNLKPQAMTISATKKQIEEKVLNMNLKVGQTYYLKMKRLDDGGFDFYQVNNSIASKEIVKTGLAGSSVESTENIISEFINPKEDDSTQVATSAPIVIPSTIPQATVPLTSVAAPISKTDEIMKAYGLKEKGIISDEEFKALKTNILNK